MKRIGSIASVGFLAMLAACEVGPDYHTPATTMPAMFDRPATTRPTTLATQAATRPVELSQWWKSLGDPELDSLVARAMSGNDDLEIALTRLQEAREMEAEMGSAEYPVLGASAGAGRGTGTNSTKGRVSGPLNAGTNTTGLREITQVAGFDAAWEPDLFGRYRRQLEATHDLAQAAADERNAVLITVEADVARAYVDYRAYQMQLAIATANIGIQKQTVDFVQQSFNRGITNELDLALANRELATLQSQVAPLAALVTAAERRVEVLTGVYPGELRVELASQTQLPAVPEKIEAGLPVDLLRRRPDIMAAERELAAATAQIGVATANLYPRVALTAGVGLQGQGLGRLPNKDSTIWSAGPTAYWPLLDFGALDAAIDLQDLRTHETLVSYRKTILDAVEEVDDAIANFDAQQERLGDLATALSASQRAVDLATQRYERGLTDFLNVLDAERQLYVLQEEYAAANQGAVEQFIALYKALGGGWENVVTPDIRRPDPAIIAAIKRAE
jgi:NodT family efflux transporter outer membrane factor (OMF) lipoprotein